MSFSLYSKAPGISKIYKAAILNSSIQRCLNAMRRFGTPEKTEVATIKAVAKTIKYQ
jgi:hypothetical protein